MAQEVTAAFLRSLFVYEPSTGRLCWKLSPSRSVPAGSVAGWIDNQGYRRVRIGARKYQASRLIWMIVHGQWPEQIDHINRNRADDRLGNLREASAAQNIANRPVFKSSTTQIKGVEFFPSGWRARISQNGKKRHLGMFDTKEAAEAAYISAAREMHGEYADCDPCHGPQDTTCPSCGLGGQHA